MRELALKQVTIEGFKSFTNLTTVTFPTTPGLRFLTGDNQLEPALGANGAGKSALWDAVCWCLYNLTTKRRKASDVVSWGSKRISVSTVWMDPSDGAEVCITRQSSPNRLYIDGDAVEQAEVDEIIGFNYDCFIQSVVFGQGVDTFYDLDNTRRGELLDEVLDIKLWLAAADTAGEQAKAVTRKLATAETSLARITGQLDGMEPDATFERLIADWDIKYEQSVENAITAVEEREAELASTHTKFSVLGRDVTFITDNVATDLASIEAKKQRYNTTINKLSAGMGGIDTELNRHTRELASYTKEGKCPTCGQYIASNMRKEKFAELNKLIDGLRIQRQAALDEIKHLEKEQEKSSMEWTRVNRAKLAAEEAYNECKWQIKALEKQVQALTEAAEKLLAQPDNPHREALQANQEKRAALTEQQVEVEGQIAALRQEHERCEFWQKGFKRLRLWLMKRVLTVLELEVAGAAATLGLPGWTIKFSTETETKSGNMRPGIHVLVGSPHAPGTWTDQSGGEEQRVRLAVAIGFAGVIQRMAGVWHRLEVWDEPSNWLSDKGIEDLIECLAHRAQTAGRCIWVVDHRTLGSGSFSEAWSVIKDGDGSRITVLAPEG